MIVKDLAHLNRKAFHLWEYLNRTHNATMEQISQFIRDFAWKFEPLFLLVFGSQRNRIQIQSLQKHIIHTYLNLNSTIIVVLFKGSY